ncbi:MAG: 6-phosphogluconolactonase [Thermoplasmata archaeon]|nr:6-phosphogluconolactonase [Thermoplasmata archaeon]
MEPRLVRQLHIYRNLSSASRALAGHLVQEARRAVQARGRFRLVLAGGRTPQPLYDLLARRYRDSMPWPQTEVYFGDERCVPPRDRESNYRMANQALLSRVPIPRRRVHRMPAELHPPAAAAAAYARELRGAAGPADASGTRAVFDLILLGIGEDGHTASLFPHSRALGVQRSWVVAVPRAGQPPYVPRLTLTLPAIASSREVCFLVAGEDKAKVVSAIFDAAPRGTPALPASLVRAQGPVSWFVDRAAAADLPGSSRGQGLGPRR